MTNGRKPVLAYLRGTPLAPSTDPIGKRVSIRAPYAPGNENLPAYRVLGEVGVITAVRRHGSAVEVQLVNDPPGTTWLFPVGDVRVLPEPARRRAVRPGAEA